MEDPEHPVTIRRVGPAGLDDLVEAQNRIFADYIVPIRSSRTFFMDFMKSVGGDLSNVLVALDGGRIVGYVTPVQDKREGWIGGIGVMPRYRGHGIGTELMAAAEGMLKERGVTDVYLEVIEGNQKAQRLYERLGYHPRRKLLCAEGRPARFEGYGDLPERATLADILPIHERSYSEACWQRKKPEAVIQSAREAEMYRAEGGFVMLRKVETNGFIPFLGVVPDKRQKGVGTSLARFALSRLHELGAFKASVFNADENEPNLRMLDKFDFKITMKQIEMRKTL
jgi:ribosomal protein S18 acetylase RimI-like enzyme